MSEPAAPQKVQAKMPKSGLSPYLAPAIVCPDRTCRELIAPLFAKEDAATGQMMVHYQCPNCLYVFKLSPQHANGEYSQPGPAANKPPEVRPRPQTVTGNEKPVAGNEKPAGSEKPAGTEKTGT